MFKRSTDDPLVRTFLDKYNLNLLSIPREKASVGDLYVHDGKRVSTPGSVTYFLDPPFEVPAAITGESMADVIGQVSNSVSVNVGLGLLEGFLTAMGAGGILAKVRAGYEAKGTKTLKFHFAQATRDYVDAMLVGSRLTDHRIKEGHALYDEGYHYYLVTAVARSPSINIIAESDNARSVNIDVDAMRIAAVPVGISMAKSNEGEVTFTGKKSLAFGVELYELRYDVRRKQLRLLLTDVGQVRGKPTHIAKPAFIGDSIGDAFIAVD